MMAVPVWGRWPPLLLSETIYPPCPARARSHPQRSVSSPLSVRVLPRTLFSRVEPCVCWEVVLSPWYKSLCTPHCTALHCINKIVRFLSQSFVLKVNQFWSQSVAGSEVSWGVIFRENSSEVLRHSCHIRNNSIVAFVPLLFLCCRGCCSWRA